MQIVNKIKKSYKQPTLILVVLLVALSIPLAAQADLGGIIVNAFFNTVLSWVLRLMSAAFALVVGAFITVVQYDFSNFWGVGEAVDIVWRVIRDLSNMFFIIVLIVIAFATMLKLEAYKWQRMLPKLLAMAILINF